MLVGYARVSTDDQNLALQHTALKQAGCKRIYEEKVPGAKRDRPALTRMLDQLKGIPARAFYAVDTSRMKVRLGSGQAHQR